MADFKFAVKRANVTVILLPCFWVLGLSVKIPEKFYALGAVELVQVVVDHELAHGVFNIWINAVLVRDSEITVVSVLLEFHGCHQILGGVVDVFNAAMTFHYLQGVGLSGILL